MSDPEDLEMIDFFRLAAIALCTVGEELTLVIGETHFNPLSEADLYTQFVTVPEVEHAIGSNKPGEVMITVLRQDLVLEEVV